MSENLSSMQPNQWYDHFRGAIYPLNLSECKAKLNAPKTVKTLRQLAADFIVKDSTTTLHASSILPQELYMILFQQALEGERDRAINVLLSKWPHPVLSIKKFAPNVFNSLKLLHSHVELTRVAKQGMQYTTSVVHNFLEALKKKTPTNRLKYVDITGYPTAEVVTFYLATHCMLAHNETRQNYMVWKYEEAVKSLPDMETREQKFFKADCSLPNDTFVVKLDAFITSERALFEVCKALKVSSFKDSTLRLVFEKLDATCLGQAKVKILLEQVNAENLKGLRLKYNSLSAEDFVALSPLMSSFIHITSLDLSCNCINIYQNDSACDAMSKLFVELINLTRLDLSNNRLKGKLRRLLSQVEKPLEYLRLAGCGLTLSDLTYLAISHHTAGLYELDISENGLGNALSALIHLLHAIQSHVQVLEIEDTGLIDEKFNSLLMSSCFSNMQCLLYINVSGNDISLPTYNIFLRSIVMLSDLSYVYMSYPRECYQQESEDYERLVQAKREFREYLEENVSREQQKLGVKKASPQFVLSELDQEMGTL